VCVAAHLAYMSLSSSAGGDRRPQSKVVQQQPEPRDAQNNEPCPAWSTQHVAFQREPDHQVAFERERDDEPDR